MTTIVVSVLAGVILAVCVYMAASFPNTRPQPPPEPTRTAPVADEWVTDVEVIHAPTGPDWEAAIQKQLDAVEERDPSSQLVAGLAIGTRIVLFYKRRIK